MARVLTKQFVAALAGPLRALRAAPRLLVFDFDGTLVPLARTPGEARLDVRTRRILLRLSRQAGTVVAVLSGRPLADLRRLLPRSLVLVGDHGLRASERGLGVPARALAPYRAAVRARLDRLRHLAAATPGALVEDKGCGAALHYGNAPEAGVAALLRASRSLFRGSGMRVLKGKAILEFCPPLRRGKADGLLRLAARFTPARRGSGACLFVGDDRTDEDAFRAARGLGRRPITVKVGAGPTLAAWRFSARLEVDVLLAALVKTRPIP